VTTYYIIDSNFFINLHEVYSEPVLPDVAQSIRGIDGVPYVTDLVIDEIRTLRYDRGHAVIDDVKKVFKVEHVQPADVEALEARIGKERSPQRTDLSLMVLADRLGRSGTALLVSDDFKIHTTQEQYNLAFKMLSPAAFFLELSNKVPDGPNRQTYRRLYRHVRRKEMEYMLSRRDTYNIEPKISWLVDNLLGAGSDARSTDQSRIVSVGGNEEVDLAPVYRYVDGEKVRGSKLAPFQRILPFLEFLKETKGADEEVRILVENGELKDALQVVHTATARLRRNLQEASLKVEENDGLKLRQVYAHYLAHYNFMQGFLSLSVGQILLAEECLDEAGFCALITRDNEDIVKASYIKALIYFSMDDYAEAREQFGTTERLARTLGIHELEFRATFGKSITAFLSGRKDLAADAMGDVHRMVEEMGMDGTMALMNFADHLFHFGRAEVALAVYNDALESALEWGQTGELQRIKDAVEECHVALNDAGVATDIGLEELIDKANDMATSCRDAYFKEVQQIAMKEAEEMRSLEVQVPDWTSGKDLPTIYKGWMEVIRFVPVREPSTGSDDAEVMHTLVLGHVHNVGTMGIYLKGSEEHSSVERFNVRLKDDGQFKVLDAPANYRKRYGVRGVIGPKDPANVEIRRQMAVPVAGKEGLKDGLFSKK
jgi:tetratricopeptide (TPR) repeat protein